MNTSKNNPLFEKLKQCRENGAVISAYTSIETPDRFTVGVIRSVTPVWTLMDCLGTDGAYDALSAIPTKNIYSIVYDDRYTRTVAAAWNGETVKLPVKSNAHDPLEAALELAMTQRLIADIEYADSGCWDVSGYIEAIEDGMLTITPVDETGDADGICFSNIAVITWVDVRPGRKDSASSSRARPAPGVIPFKSHD